MSFREILRFEIAYQSRRPSTWLFFVLLLGIATHMAREIYIGAARRDGYFFNAPFVIAAVTLLGSIMALLAPAALAGDAGARDIRTRMHALLFTLPVSRIAYLGGRFLGAFLVAALVMLALPAAHLLATVLPGPEAALIGPHRPAAYVIAYAFLALPNAFVASALPFALAVLTRRQAASYLASVLLFFLAVASWQLLGATLGHWELAKLLDPLGLAAMSELSRTWTPDEKSTRLLAVEGSLLLNRLLWVGVATGALLFTLVRFRFAHESARLRWSRSQGRPRALSPAAPEPRGMEHGVVPVAVPHARRAFGPATIVRQAAAITLEAFRTVVKGWGGLALAVLTVLLVLSGPATMQHMGVPILPATGYVTAFIGDFGEPLWAVVPLLIVYYAGELVWRERDAGLAEIADAAPVAYWLPFAGCFLGLALVLVLLQLLVMAATMLVQAGAGYNRFELGLYARILFGLQLADYLLFTLLALAVHVVVNQKYVGHMLALLGFAVMAFGSEVGMDQSLLVYGSDPGWSYSDMRGFAPYMGPWLLFKIYWAAWGGLIAIGAAMLWVRGAEEGVASRLRRARERVTGRVARAALASAGLICVLGGFAWYNTHVLANQRSATEVTARRADYERRFGGYAGVPQPRLVSASLRVDIHPHRRALDIHGIYSLVNASARAIDTVHVAAAWEVVTGEVTFDRAAALALRHDELGHRTYLLGTSLHPGDTLRMSFDVHYAVRGFPRGSAHLAVVPNGSYVRSGWLPAIGYQRSRELTAAGVRRLHGLPLRAAIPPLSDSAARNDLAAAEAEMIALEAIVSTDSAQVAVAPGALRQSWTEGDRRYFHYVTDEPIRNDYAFFSAAYAVYSGRWRDVRLEVLHHPAHAHNVERMLGSMQASLDYLGERFGRYPHGQMRLVEHPGRATSLHAYPVNISYNEGFSLFDPANDPRDIDFPFAVVAHEIAHQWWGNRLTPAFAEGGPLLTESLAWYSAFGVVESAHGTDHLQRLLSMMRAAYLTPRSRAGLPLLRAHDWFHAYRKGPFAMYALREYVGEERVNAALRRLLQAHDAGSPPLPTSHDLYRELRSVAPDSLLPLLSDLFEANTFWELESTHASAEPEDPGTWHVSLDVRARKVEVDSTGTERELPMDDLVEVGVFGDGGSGAPDTPLYLGLHRVRSGEQRIIIRVRGQPLRAGIDPRNLLIDVEPGDNLTPITHRSASAGVAPRASSAR